MRRATAFVATALVCLVAGSNAEASWHLKAKQVVRRDALRVRARLAIGVGRAVGYAETAGLRFKVKPYQQQVSRHLWRGSRVDETGLADLKARGFTAVVGLTAERNLDADARAVGIKHMRIPILDNSTPTTAQVHQFLAFVKSQRGKVYVHCEAGVGRTGIMVAAYRMEVEGWGVGRALVEAREHGLVLRNQVDFIRALGRELKRS